MRHDIDDDRTERNRRGRRRVLVSIGTAAAVGLAGCSGGSEPGGGSPGAVGPATCSDLTAGYTALNPGERPLTFQCERPESLSDLTYTSPPGFNVKMRPPNANDADYPKLLEITQTARHQGQTEEPYDPGTDEEGVSTVEFEYAGETLQAGVGSVENDTLTASTRLPYEFRRGKRYVDTLVMLRVFVEATDGSVGEECPPNMEETVRHVIESLEPNPQSTIQSVTAENN